MLYVPTSVRVILNASTPFAFATNGSALVPVPLHTSGTPPTVSETELPCPSTAVTGAVASFMPKPIPALILLPVTGGLRPVPASTASLKRAGILRL